MSQIVKEFYKKLASETMEFSDFVDHLFTNQSMFLTELIGTEEDDTLHETYTRKQAQQVLLHFKITEMKLESTVRSSSGRWITFSVAIKCEGVGRFPLPEVVIREIFKDDAYANVVSFESVQFENKNKVASRLLIMMPAHLWSHFDLMLHLHDNSYKVNQNV